MRRRRRRILPGDYLPLGQRGPRGAVRVQTAALNVVLLWCPAADAAAGRTARPACSAAVALNRPQRYSNTSRSARLWL